MPSGVHFTSCSDDCLLAFLEVSYRAWVGVRCEFDPCTGRGSACTASSAPGGCRRLCAAAYTTSSPGHETCGRRQPRRCELMLSGWAVHAVTCTSGAICCCTWAYTSTPARVPPRGLGERRTRHVRLEDPRPVRDTGWSVRGCFHCRRQQPSEPPKPYVAGCRAGPLAIGIN
jgi:hypothetical protein